MARRRPTVNVEPETTPEEVKTPDGPNPEETPTVEETPEVKAVSLAEESVEELVKEAPKAACPDCTVLIADGGKSEFSGKGGPKAGLINPNTQCPTCEGHGVVEAKEE